MPQTKKSATKPKPQVFNIHLELKTECNETVTEAEVLAWLEEKFDGCDIGKVTIQTVHEW